MNKYILLLKKNKEVLLYLVFGVLTTVVNLIAFSIFTQLLNTDLFVSNIIAWIVSVTFAYITNKIFVFESRVTKKAGVIKELLLFYLYRIASLIIEIIILFIFVTLLHMDEIVIKIIANILVIIINYIFSKWIIFKKS